MKAICIFTVFLFSTPASAIYFAKNAALATAWPKGFDLAAPGLVFQKTLELGVNDDQKLGFAGISLDHYYSNHFNLTAVLRGFFLENRMLWANIKLDLPTSILLLTGQSTASDEDTWNYFNWGLMAGVRLPFSDRYSTSLFTSFESFVPSFRYHTSSARFFSFAVGLQFSVELDLGNEKPQQPK